MKIADGTPYTSPACEDASEQDRRYFAAHPGETIYCREAIRGEFPPGLAAGYAYVLVTQLKPGLRVRQPARLIVLPEANSCN